MVEHQGVLPGFNSQIAVAPDDGVGVVALIAGGRNAATWLTAESMRLLGDLVHASPDGIRTDIPTHPEIWSDLCGLVPAEGPNGPTCRRGDARRGVEVGIRRGRLTIRTLSPIPGLFRGLPLHPDDARDPYAFRLDLSRFGLGTAGVVFDRAPRGMTTGVHLDGLLLSAQRREGRPKAGSA